MMRERERERERERAITWLLDNFHPRDMNRKIFCDQMCLQQMWSWEQVIGEDHEEYTASPTGVLQITPITCNKDPASQRDIVVKFRDYIMRYRKFKKMIFIKNTNKNASISVFVCSIVFY